MTFIPAAAARLLPEGSGATTTTDGFLARTYRSVAGICYRARYLVVLAAAGLLALAIQGFQDLGTELFPRTDSGQFTILVRAPVGTRLEKTEELVAEVEAEIQAIVGAADPGNADPTSDLALLISNIGVLYDWPAAYTFNNGPMDAFILCQLKDEHAQTPAAWASSLRKHLNARFPGIEFAFDTGGMLTAALNQGIPAPIDVQVQGSSLEISHEIARAIVNELSQIDGVHDVRIEQPLDYPAVKIEVDRVKAALLGLTQEEVVKNVVTALNSSVSFKPSFWIDPKNGNHYFIGSQYPTEEIVSFETLENIPITGKHTERSVLLKNIARLERTSSPAVIKHINITRTVDVYANVEGRDLGSAVKDIEERLATSAAFTTLMDEYSGRGYSYEVKGEIQTMRESFGQFQTGLIIAALLVFLVMVAQLRSFALPLVIMLTVPLGLIGVVASLHLTNTPLSIPAFMGLILMVGLVVQYSILLVDFTVRRQREGADLETAILDAASARLRPLLMTSLTTVLALLPMALGLGEGAEANVPLARAVIGAVLGGAILTLFVVPALYGIVGRFAIPSPTTGEAAL
jgi:multidrug efflux pump subunit AcrB